MIALASSQEVLTLDMDSDALDEFKEEEQSDKERMAATWLAWKKTHDTIQPCVYQRQAFSPKIEARIVAEEAMFSAKLFAYHEFGVHHDLKPTCKLVSSGIFMSCKACCEWKPRTSRFFQEANMQNWETCPPGCESLRALCRDCKSHKGKEQKDYKKSLINNYPQLSVEWLDAQFDEQVGRGQFSLSRMQFVTNGAWRVSIHALDNDLGHSPENCVLDVLELNVPQHKAIPDLEEAIHQWISQTIAFLDGTGGPAELFSSWQAAEASQSLGLFEVKYDTSGIHGGPVHSSLIDNHKTKDWHCHLQ